MFTCILVSAPHPSMFSCQKCDNLTVFIFSFPHSRRGNCKNVTLGMDCEVGLRRRTYNVLSGCVLSVWTKVEDLLNSRTGHNSKMQVVRMKASDGLKIVGK